MQEEISVFRKVIESKKKNCWIWDKACLISSQSSKHTCKIQEFYSLCINFALVVLNCPCTFFLISYNELFWYLQYNTKTAYIYWISLRKGLLIIPDWDQPRLFALFQIDIIYLEGLASNRKNHWLNPIV